MTETQIITLVIAILGVLHGPLVPLIAGRFRNGKTKP